MKKLNFGQGLMLPALNGQKRITLRKWKEDAYDFLKNEIVMGVFQDGFNILLRITAETEIKLFSDMVDEEAQEDGFKNARDAFRGLKNYYPDLKKTDVLAIVRFEILKVDYVPVVSLNQQ